MDVKNKQIVKFKKSKLLKVNIIENENNNENIKKSIKENKIIRKMKKEDLINEPKLTRLRQNPKKKTIL